MLKGLSGHRLTQPTFKTSDKVLHLGVIQEELVIGHKEILLQLDVFIGAIQKPYCCVPGKVQALQQAVCVPVRDGRGSRSIPVCAPRGSDPACTRSGFWTTRPLSRPESPLSETTARLQSSRTPRACFRLSVGARRANYATQSGNGFVVYLRGAVRLIKPSVRIYRRCTLVPPAEQAPCSCMFLKAQYISAYKPEP